MTKLFHHCAKVIKLKIRLLNDDEAVKEYIKLILDLDNISKEFLLISRNIEYFIRIIVAHL